MSKLIFVVVRDGHFVGAAQSVLNYGYEVGLVEEVNLALLVQFPAKCVWEVFRLFDFEVVV